MAGAFLWSYKANSFFEEGIFNGCVNRLTGWHDGYHRLEDPVTHRRTITFYKDQKSVIINDYLEMKANHKVEQYFHLAPKCRIDRIESNILRITNCDKTIEFVSDPKLESKIYQGQKESLLGVV